MYRLFTHYFCLQSFSPSVLWNYLLVVGNETLVLTVTSDYSKQARKRGSCRGGAANIRHCKTQPQIKAIQFTENSLFHSFISFFVVSNYLSMFTCLCPCRCFHADKFVQRNVHEPNTERLHSMHSLVEDEASKSSRVVKLSPEITKAHYFLLFVCMHLTRIFIYLVHTA